MDSLLQCGVSVKKQFLGGTAIPERSSELPSRLETLEEGLRQTLLLLFLINPSLFHDREKVRDFLEYAKLKGI